MKLTFVRAIPCGCMLRRETLTKTLRIMKLLALFLCVGCLHVAAAGFSQVTLNERNAPLKKIFTLIKQQTGYDFLYPQTVLEKAGTVTVSFSNVSLQDALDACLADKDLEYTIADKTVVIRKRHQNTFLGELISAWRSIEISGFVLDENGEPLAGVTVTVKGSSNATATGSDGSFQLHAVDPSATIVLTGANIETLSYHLRGERQLKLKTKRKVNPLDDVQIIAYGTSTKRFTTGNVSTVQGKDIENQPVSSPVLALAGRIPGLFVTQSSGFPGAGVNTRIQGKNSISKGNDPFFVIDGVPYPSQMLRNLGGFVGSSNDPGFTGSTLNYINAADIESITVLKDADATAIYGSRAANGAILITTKKGKAGKLKIDLNLQNSWGKLTRKRDLLNLRQYLDMRHEAINNDGLTVQPTDYDVNGFWDTTRTTDWQKELLGGTAQNSMINATVSGGTANTQYLVGGTWQRVTNVFPGDFSDIKGSAHFSINTVSDNQKFHFTLSGSYLVDRNRLPSADLTSLALTLPPDAPSLYNADGSINWALDANGNSTWANYGQPLATMLQHYQANSTNVSGNSVIGYDIFKGLRLQSSFGYSNLRNHEIVTAPLTVYEPAARPYNSRYSFFTDNSIVTWIAEPQLTYKRDFSFGKLDILLGTTIQQTNSVGQNLTASGFNSDASMESIQSATSITASNSDAVYKYNALFGRINYILKDKYIINLSARRDGSSRFGSANRFNNFGAVGLGWIFSEERGIHAFAPFLSFGKLKVSYGTTGSDQIGDYAYLNLYNPVFSSVPYQNTTGLSPNRLTNPYLQWEESRKINLGLDLGFIDDRILLGANFFRNRSSNQLVAQSLPIITGFASISRNFPAVVQNAGWELTLNTVNIKTRHFQWTSYLNLTIPRNKLIKYDNLANSTDASRFIIGKPVSMLKVFHVIGVDPATGIYQFADVHGNPTQDPGAADLYVRVNTDPTLYGGFQNTITYKTVSLDFLFQYVKRNAQNYSRGFYPGSYLNQPVEVLDRWQKPGDVTNIQRYNSDFSIADPFRNVTFSSDATYSDATFVRLRTVSLNWQMPGSWAKKVRMNNFSFFLLGQNLLTITGYKGLDPETPGLSSLPPLKTITLGLRAGF